MTISHTQCGGLNIDLWTASSTQTSMSVTRGENPNRLCSRPTPCWPCSCPPAPSRSAPLSPLAPHSYISVFAYSPLFRPFFLTPRPSPFLSLEFFSPSTLPPTINRGGVTHRGALTWPSAKRAKRRTRERSHTHAHSDTHTRGHMEGRQATRRGREVCRPRRVFTKHISLPVCGVVHHWRADSPHPHERWRHRQRSRRSTQKGV